MANVTIYRLPKTEDSQILATQSRPLRLARLQSLQFDAQSFSSKYDDEVKQPEGSDFWLNRLRPKHVQHFVAVQSDGSSALGQTLPIDQSTEFKGVLVLINEYEEKLEENANMGVTSQAISEDELPNLFLGAFWVDGGLRGQGIGARMVNDSIVWLVEDARSKNWPKIRYRVTVKKSNDGAIKLYKKLGFSRIEDDKRRVHDESDGFIELSMIIDTA